MSNMIGRENHSVPQSAIGPISTVVVITFVFFSTAHYFYITIMYTMQGSQKDPGVVGNVARCCGRCAPKQCGAQVEVKRETTNDDGDEVNEQVIYNRSPSAVVRAGT